MYWNSTALDQKAELDTKTEIQVSIKIEMEKMSETFPVANWPPPVTSTPLAISFEQPTRKAKEKKKCGDCGVMFNRYHECPPKKDEKCNYCQRILSSRNLRNHEKTCKIFYKYVEFGNEAGARVKCKVCPREFITQAAVFRLFWEGIRGND